MLNKQKGYYAPDLSGCLPMLVALGIFALFGLYQLGHAVVWLWDSVSFSF